MARRLLAILIALAVAGALTWALWPRPVEVETATVTSATLTVTVEAEGKARIRDVYTVSAPIAGQLQRVALDAGDPVTEGKTVVARIQPMAPPLLDLRARRVAEAVRDAATVAVDLAKIQVTQASAELTFRQDELRRAETLREREAISARDHDAAVLAQSEALAALSSAQATLLVRERELQSASAALIQHDEAATDEDCCTELLAPVSGRVLRVLTESEQTVAAGTPILEIGDPALLEIEADFLSSDAVRVTEGAAAVIDGWGGPALPAHVLRVDPSAETEVSALGIEEQRVTIRLALDGDPAARQALGDGYRVLAHVTVWQGEGLTAVPVGALFRQGADWAVYRVEDGRARLVRVTLGERTDSLAEVTAGLAVDDRVILHPSDRVTDGTAVTALADG